jgi:hypothetical protein
MIDHGIIDASVAKRVPENGRSELIAPLARIGASKILMVETQADNVDYSDIQAFGVGIMRSLARRKLDPTAIGMILHGPGYGLDTEASFSQLLLGLQEGLEKHGDSLESLGEIVIVEQQSNRRERMEARLAKLWPSHDSGRAPPKESQAAFAPQPQPSIFCAMPFDQKFLDVWEYGIYNPCRDIGCLCERSDHAAFTGDIMDWITARIQQASLVIADVSVDSPNVALEIGYAWGLNKPTLLISRDHPPKWFDLRNHKCTIYSTIKELELHLRDDLPKLLSLPVTKLEHDARIGAVRRLH